MESLLLVVGLLAVPSVPFKDGYEAPVTETSVPFLAIICALVALGGIAVVALRDAKRTHLD